MAFIVDILAVVVLKCRWTDRNRDFDSWTDFNINLRKRKEMILFVQMQCFQLFMGFAETQLLLTIHTLL